MAGAWLVLVAAMLAYSHAQMNACFPDEVPEVPRADLPKDVTKFSLGLFKKVVYLSEAGRSRTREGGHLKTRRRGTVRSGGGRNTVISPYSVWSTLVLAYMGAEGRTKQQLARVLRLSSKTAAHNNYRFVLQMLSEETIGMRRRNSRRRKTQSTEEYNVSSRGSATASSHTNTNYRNTNTTSNTNTTGNTNTNTTSNTNTTGNTNTTSNTNYRNTNTNTTSNSPNTILTSTNRAYFANHIVLRPCLLENLPEIIRLDFTRPALAARQINNDVNMATRGEIDNLVESGDVKNAEFLLLNAVYFKGMWQTVFPPDNTELGTFRASQHLARGLVPMMRVIGKFKFVSRSSLNASVLELPYTTGFSMLLLLPSLDVWRAEDVVRRLTYGRIQEARDALLPMDVEVMMPKFKITSRVSYQLKKALMDLGVTDLFTGAANLRTFSSNLRLDSVVHQATVTVSEEGTTAAAATALIGTRIGPTKFTANRPFVFLIVDDLLGVPVVAGVYNGPP